MSRPLIIALMGRAGAGKDTAARYLTEHHGFEPWAFATPLKDMLQAMFVAFGVPHDDYLHDSQLKQVPIPELGGHSARQLMQTLGDWGRRLDEQWWIKATAANLGLPDAPVHDRIVITDCRYPNEAGWVRAQGGRLWLIERKDLPKVPMHASEYSHHQVVPDHRVPNHHSIAALQFELDCAVAELEGATA